jgi:hypothetical protein
LADEPGNLEDLPLAVDLEPGLRVWGVGTCEQRCRAALNDDAVRNNQIQQPSVALAPTNQMKPRPQYNRLPRDHQHASATSQGDLQRRGLGNVEVADEVARG